ncbi:MAG: hypothetical protein QF491_21060 [Alphaproteobacteria bacterium]|nr:hypothetical protein [Alphaproteobacteria bacterium]
MAGIDLEMLRRLGSEKTSRQQPQQQQHDEKYGIGHGTGLAS